MRQSWRLLIVDESDPQALALSPVLAETMADFVGRGLVPPTILLRWHDPYVLLGPTDGRLPGVKRGVAWLERLGLPVYMRISGGTAVLLDEGCLSFAVAVPCRDLTMLRDNYKRLMGGVIDALRSFGVAAEFGEAPGSYCPGPYDLVAANGRKIAGIAQAMRRGFAEVGGMLLLSQQPEAAVEVLEGFYVAAGDPRRYDRNSVTNLSELCGRVISRDEAAAAIKNAYAAQFHLVEGDLTAAERRLARQLMTRRRLTALPAARP